MCVFVCVSMCVFVCVRAADSRYGESRVATRDRNGFTETIRQMRCLSRLLYAATAAAGGGQQAEQTAAMRVEIRPRAGEVVD